MDYVGKRFRAVVELGEPIGNPRIAIGEEFTVTADMVAVQQTSLGPYALVDFDSLVASGAIEPVPTARPVTAAKASPGEGANGG
jgi:hypothetical protein